MNFEELTRRTQDNLIKFLSVEVELAQTMCDMSETTRSPEHRARLLDNARKATQAILYFKERIADASLRNELTRKAAKLEEFLAAE